MILNNFYKNKKIFVTGATGFKGAWLCLWLNMLGAKVNGIGYRPNDNKRLFNQLNLRKKILFKNLDIRDFIKSDKTKNNLIPSLLFKKVNNKIFPIIKIKDRANEHASTSIIINAANEILVDQFLQKKIPFLTISKIIMNILNDRNYRKYAIKKPKNISQIKNIDTWARTLTMRKLINE